MSKTNEARSTRRMERVEMINVIIRTLTCPMTTMEIVNATGYEKSRVSFNIGVLLGTYFQRNKEKKWSAIRDFFNLEDYETYLVHDCSKPKPTERCGRIITIEDYSEKRLLQSKNDRADRFKRGYGKVYVGCSFSMY